MESISKENFAYNSEQNFSFEQKTSKPAKKETPILLQVFKEVFGGFFTGIGKGVFNFFKRYFVLIWNCTKFLWKPNADEHTKANDRTIHNAKETFELILILTAITLFLIKQDVIVSTDELKEIYGNDLGQYAMEFFFFLCYSVIFFVVLTILVLLGRLLHVIFKPIESRDVTDKVFINLNNIFFIITIVYSFIRKFDPYNSTDLQNIEEEWYAIWFVSYAIPLAVVVFLFFIRLVMINKVTIGRALAYCIITPAITVVILALSGLFLTALFAGI
jgi:hypothetical protein